MVFPIKIMLIFFLFASFSSCNEEKAKSSMIYTSGGKTSEVLVVISDENWKSMVGDTIKSVLQEINPWLVQAEPMFDLFQIEHESFMDIYQKYRNVLIVRINDNIEQNQIKAKNNVYAKPQTIIELKCKSKADFMNMFSEYENQIIDLFHKNELNRIQDAYNGLEIDSISRKLINKFGFKLVIPQGFYVAVNQKDFVWLRKLVPDIEEGILIYTQPYKSTADFETQSIINRRNEFTKRYIPGPVDSSWMKVSNVFPPFSEQIDFKGNYATMVRSWWDVENYAMGGPFINYTFVDTVKSQLIVFDGFIKAPKKDKRDLLLQVEAIIYSYIK